MKRHNERCAKCKESVAKQLRKLYGDVESNPKFTVGTVPHFYRAQPQFDALSLIYEMLQKHRGFTNLVKVDSLPRCDFLIKRPNFLVEFDESQHFTLPRKKALSRYPRSLGLGFNRNRWIGLCDEISATDNTPPYRDEQRAWYDTLRDFLPTYLGVLPTVRLFARDAVWCCLSSEDFKKLFTKTE